VCWREGWGVVGWGLLWVVHQVPRLEVHKRRDQPDCAPLFPLLTATTQTEREDVVSDGRVRGGRGDDPRDDGVRHHLQ